MPDSPFVLIGCSPCHPKVYLVLLFWPLLSTASCCRKTSPAPNQTGSATQAVSFCYDELHRVVGKGYGAQSCPLATPVVTYAYDSGTNAKGHLTSLTDQPGTANYSYDILGRLITETRTLTGANNAAISKTISYTYNLDGSVKTLTYPSNKVITYAPDSAGRMLSAVDSASAINYVTGATYGPDSALTGFISGSGGACRDHQRLQLQQALAAGDDVGLHGEPDGVFHQL